MAVLRRPDIPKAMAARIRGAQEKLRLCIESQAWADEEIPELEAKLRAFDADPDGWAQANYRGHGKDSYPVQTHISRAREKLAYRLRRRPEKIQELEDAQKNLAQIEAEVLEKVAAMKPTPGRVPWPKPIPGLEATVRRVRAHIEQETARWAARQARLAEERARDEARDAAEREAEDNAAIRRHVAQGPEHVLRHFMEAEAVIAAFERHKTTEAYKVGVAASWSGGLISFVTSAAAEEAAREGRRQAEAEITEARSLGIDLWDLCRRLGFHTPESVAALDLGLKVPLSPERRS